MATNPLYYDTWFKTETHNSNSPMCGIYEKGIEQMINIYGTALLYFPISEYDLDGISKLWGEDINKKYLEKYTLKGLTDGENDTFAFNRFGVDKTGAERIVFLSKKQFSEITGRQEPLEGDMFQWTQNQIVYEVNEVTDQENIVLGKELTWRLSAMPRLVEGEVFGTDTCDSTRDQVDDSPATECSKTEAPIGDGNVIEDPDNVHIPGQGKSHETDDSGVIEDEKSDVLIRNSWGNW